MSLSNLETTRALIRIPEWEAGVQCHWCEQDMETLGVALRGIPPKGSYVHYHEECFLEVMRDYIARYMTEYCEHG